MNITRPRHAMRRLAMVSASLLLSTTALAAGVSAATTPTLSSYRVISSSQGTELVLTGTGFGTSSSGSTVTVDGDQTSVVSWSDTSITVSVPTSAGPGTITVDPSGASPASLAFSGIERGYYSLTSDGVVVPHGDAQTYGDLSTLSSGTVSGSAVSMAVTSDGLGYWILTSSGQVFPFGDATPWTSSLPSGATAVDLAVNPSGQGGYILTSDGSVYSTGTASAFGNASLPTGTKATSMAVTPSGNGYWILGSDGTVYPFGDANSHGNVNLTQDNPSYANGSLLKVSGTTPVFMLQNGTLHHIPNATVFAGMGLSWSDIHTVSSLSSYHVGPPLVAPFVSGSLLRPSGSPKVYLVMGGVLHHIATSAVFIGMGLSWSSVKTVPSINVAWPKGTALTSAAPYFPSGTVLKGNSAPTVYMVNTGVLDPISTADVFLAMGYQWSQITRLATLPSLPHGSSVTSAARVFPTGTLVRQNNTDPVYLVQNGILRHIPNPTALVNLGFSFSDVHVLASLSGFTKGTDLESTAIPPATATPAGTAVSIAPTTDGGGYWVLGSTGGVYAKGDAASLGSPTLASGHTALSLTETPDGGGYLVQTTSGTYSFGDAKTFGWSGKAESLAVTSVPSSGLLSMGYGFFDVNTANGAYQDLQQNASELSAINPAWFNVKQNTNGSWSLTNWTTGVTTGTGQSNIQMVTNTADQNHVEVMPSIGSSYDPAHGPISTTADVTSLVSQIVQWVKSDGLDGITIDFENNSNYATDANHLLPDGQLVKGPMTTAEASQQYTTFIQKLGPALHQVGKKLMVAVYPSSYPGTIYDYSAIAPYVDYLNIMTYPEHNSSTTAGPTAGYPWVKSLAEAAINTGVTPSKIILGVAPYAHDWTYSNSGIVAGSAISDRTIQSMLSSKNITPIWDPWQKEITFTAGSPAVAPPAPLSTSDVGTIKATVKNLQGILNYILLAYAVQNGQTTEPPLLVTDGDYGGATASAVALFQQDFNVQGATSGHYDAATAAALAQVISQDHVDSTVYWDDDSQSFAARLSLAIQDKLGGVDSWRMPFESPGYWSALKSGTAVIHY